VAALPAARCGRIAISCRCRQSQTAKSWLPVLSSASAPDRPSCKVFLAGGLDEILTANRLQLPPELRRSLACTNNYRGTTRGGAQREALAPCLDGTAVDRAGMMRAQAGFRRLNAHRQLPAFGGALAINARANVRMSTQNCRTTTSCFGPDSDSCNAAWVPKGRTCQWVPYGTIAVAAIASGRRSLNDTAAQPSPTRRRRATL
jgi:hypothetical protein